ncbi:MAG: class I SAM-dependent methyltransferase [Pyrinomonadaceae bacterium]
MNDTIERFSNRVANYVKYRPGYPHAVIEHLAENCGLTRESIIADVGCGPGQSSRSFLENGNRVIGVEPNEAMRAAAGEILGEFENFSVVDGTSENTTLPDASVDMIVAAQAFHWFGAEKTRPEFNRILKPGGRVVLIWNERQLDTTPFLIEYEHLLLRYATDYTKVRHENVDALKLGEFFQTDHGSAVFENAQTHDFEGLKGRMFSASYMPGETDAIATKLSDELAELFAKHARNGKIEIIYDTRIYCSLPK